MSLAMILALIGNQFRLAIKSVKEGHLKNFFHQIINGVVLITVTLVVFIIYLPIILQLLIFCLVGLVLITAVVGVMSALNILPDGMYDFQNIDGTQLNGSSYSAGSMDGKVTFTEQELASYGNTLSGYEKNIYRLGILATSAVDAYAGTTELAKLDKRASSLMLLGIASTETGMRFYESGEYDKTKNILTDPSDKKLNSYGFGTMGLCGMSPTCTNGSTPWVLSNLGSAESNTLTQKWGTPTRSNDINFYPYAVFFTYKHLESKTSVTSNYIDRAIEILNDNWGIHSNIEEHRTVIYHMMLQAAYHGVSFPNEIDHYANFWGAILHSTSDIDSERSFYKWSIASDSKDYSESSMRISMFGAGACHNFPKNGDPSTWSGTQTPITLNGVTIDKPLWSYLYAKYKDNKGFMGAVQRASSWGADCKVAGASARVLNFHYGFNSFLQGNAVVERLSAKMNIPVASAQSTGSIVLGANGTPVMRVNGYLKEGQKLRTTPIGYVQQGKAYGTATINNSSISVSDHLESYYSTRLSDSYRGRKQYLASSAYLRGKHPINTNPDKFADYSKYNFFNVPHYMQHTTKYSHEDYVHLTAIPNGTFLMGDAGCMFYSMAFVATALTGEVINPIEMALYLQSRDYVTPKGYSYDQYHGKAISELTGGKVTSKYFTSSSHSKLMDSVLSEINNHNAIAIIRLGGIYAYTSNHYVVITGAVKNADGTVSYSMYSSSDIEDSSKLHSATTLKQNPGDGNKATVFYY